MRPEPSVLIAPLSCTIRSPGTGRGCSDPTRAAIVVPQAIPIVIPGSSISSSIVAPASATACRRSRSSSVAPAAITCAWTPYSWEIRRRSSSTRCAPGGRSEICTSPASRASRSIRETVDRETDRALAMASIVWLSP